MSNKEQTNLEVASGILGNTKKSVRLIIILLIFAIVIISGFFSGAIKFSWTKGTPVQEEPKAPRELPKPAE